MFVDAKKYINKEDIDTTILTPELIDEISSGHIQEHFDNNKEDIKNRLLYNRYKNEITPGTSYGVRTKTVSTWTISEKMVKKYICAALNKESVKNIIKNDIKNFFESKIQLEFKAPFQIGVINSRNGSFEPKDGTPCSKFRIVLQIESSGKSANAGYSILTAYPIPTEEENKQLEKAVAEYQNKKKGR